MWWFGTAFAVTFTVTAGGALSLEDALDQASSGDTVEIGPGTHPVSARVEHEITVRGTGPGVLLVPDAAGETMLTFRRGGTLENVTIDGQNAEQLLLIESGPEMLLHEVVLMNGEATEGGALRAQGNGLLTITDSHFEGNWADEEGALFGRSLFCSGAVSGTLDVDGCDLGTSSGGDDNSPDDVAVDSGSVSPDSYSDYGSSVTFTCDATGCD